MSKLLSWVCLILKGTSQNVIRGPKLLLQAKILLDASRLNLRATSIKLFFSYSCKLFFYLYLDDIQQSTSEESDRKKNHIHFVALEALLRAHFLFSWPPME